MQTSDQSGLDDLSRRAFLQYAAGVLGVSWLSIHAAVTEAAQHAQEAPGTPPTDTLVFLATHEGADVEAVAAQIIPSDDTPGATEAGAVFFIDRALASFFAPLAETFKMELTAFQSAYRSRYPDAPSFGSLPVETQITFLRTVEHTPFFRVMRLLTILGTFADPSYGGNRGGAGWKLLGFEDQHVFAPPFGYYDQGP